MFLEIRRIFLVSIVTTKINLTIVRKKSEFLDTLLHFRIESTRNEYDRLFIGANIIQSNDCITVQHFSRTKIITNSAHVNAMLPHQGKRLMSTVTCAVKNDIVAVRFQLLQTLGYSINTVSYFHVILLD